MWFFVVVVVMYSLTMVSTVSHGDREICCGGRCSFSWRSMLFSSWPVWFLITILDVVSHYHTGCDFSWLSMWFLITILDVTSHGCPYGFSSAAVAGL